MDKSTLRKTYLEKRIALSTSEYEQRNKRLKDKLFELIDFNSIEYVHLFLPIAKFKEVNTWLIMEQLSAQYPHIKLVIPKVNGHKLEHYLFESQDQLATNAWGIDEPTYGDMVSPDILNIVLVPLVVADKHGNRIGYGKGFYDRFLKQCPPSCQTIGLSLLPILDKIECIESTDFVLDTILTP